MKLNSISKLCGPTRCSVITRVGLLALLLGTIGCGGSGALSQKDLLKYGISRSDDDEEEDEDAAPPEPVIDVAAERPDPNSRPEPTNQADQIAASSDGRSTTSEVNVPVNSANEPEASPNVESTADIASGNGINSNARKIDSSDPTEAVSQPSPTSQAQKASSQAVGGIEPIEMRRPAGQLSIEERRRMSIANMERINAAILKWIENSYKLPASVAQDTRGRAALSWRVQILPYLGYEDLYNQFSKKEPWNGPTNKALLKYIPDEFVSPERFDVDTNYQLFVNGPALFSEVEEKDKSEISDGPKILMLAEVDENLRVPWTSPFDYDVTEDKLTRGIGHLREDGVFVGWMTGQIALWPNPINAGTIRKAITFEAGDGVPFGPYMHYPPETPGGSGRPGSLVTRAIPSSSGTAGSTSTSLASSSTYANTAESSVGNALGPDVQQVELPSRELILEAQEKVRATYEAEYKRARTPAELAQLAQKVHRQLTEVEVPPADLFAGLRAALNVAVAGKEPRLALKLIDELDARFVLDRSEFEGAMLEGFLGNRGSLRMELSKASVLIPLLEDVISQDIEKDNFRAAGEKLSYGNAVIRTVSDRETAYRWKVLKERVNEGKRLFPKIANQIEMLRENPEDERANYFVGWYLCMIKNNWMEGLTLLAKTDDQQLRQLAQLEIQEDSSLTVHLRMADSWFDYAKAHEDEELVFEASMRRARNWYLSASIGLADGLDRIRANNQLDMIDRLIGKAPVDESRGRRS